MYKGVIFDLDGTLLDTVEDLRSAVNKTRANFGLEPLDRVGLMNNVGNGFRVLIELSLPGKSEEDINAGLTQFTEYYSACYMDQTKAYSGIGEMLEELSKLNIKLGVCSNKRDSYTKNLIKKNFPNIEFVSVFGQRDGVPKKPDPTTVLEILDNMRLKKEEVLYVGDSQPDMKTAINAGLRPIGVSWGFRSKEVIKEAGADIIVDDAKEIVSIVKEG